jgi:chromosome segregation ATPase
MSTETEIQSAIEVLRGQFPETKALYREVCALLFFRHGITPTASKLYQYVRKGSMSAPTEALGKFWEDLRNKARVEIDRPDLPDEVKAVAADAIQALWSHATERAGQELAASRIEQQAEVQRAQAAERAALQRVEASAGTIASLQTQLDAAGEQLRLLQAELEAERRAHVATAAKGQELQRQTVGLQDQITAARGDFSAELDKARQAVQAADERAAGAQRKALLEVEQERTARNKADKTLEAVRAQLAEAESRLRDLAVQHAEEGANLRGQISHAEASEKRLQAALDERIEETRQLQVQLTAQREQVLQATAQAQATRELLDHFKLEAAGARVKKPKSARAVP